MGGMEDAALQWVSVDAAKSNARSLGTVRTVGAICAGCAAGVLGLTGLSGFGMYFGNHALGTLLLWVWCGGDVKAHMSYPGVVIHGELTSGISSFILFWTLLYCVCHIY